MGNKIVVVGGRTAGIRGAGHTHEVFDGTSWHDAAGIPIPGDHLAAASDGTYLYAVGGRKLDGHREYRGGAALRPGDRPWTQLPPMPSPVSDCGAAVVGGQLITVGGESTGTVFSTVRAYDLTTAAWSSLPNLAVARHGRPSQRSATPSTPIATRAAETGHNAIHPAP